MGAANIQLTRLQVYYGDFKAEHNKILKLEKDNPTHPYFASNIIQEVEDDYWDIRGQFTDYIKCIEAENKAKAQPPVLPTQSPQAAGPVYSLSKLDIPTFSGKYNDWENFRDLFRSLVHTIQRDSERGDDMVVFMITSRFDNNTLQQW